MERMRPIRVLGVLGVCALVISGCGKRGPAAVSEAPAKKPWVAVHLFAPWHPEVPQFKRVITEALEPLGVNTIILEVNYKFAFQSHPELREPGNSLTREDVRELVDVCRKSNIRLIPLFNCLGHQSWSTTTLPLLRKYPQLDETPRVPADNAGIYCRSWCPSNPLTDKLVFDLLGELIDAFQPKYFHVGMDEVFLIASDQCPLCRGKDPAQLFAKQVNNLHDFLVKKHHLTMMMWGDRLIDRKRFDYGNDYECSANGTAPAIDQIPKDIILCDWHYGDRAEFPSLVYFQQKGFRVLPTTWHNAEATRRFINYARRTATPRMIGHLFTTWVGSREMLPALLGEGDPSKWPPEAVAAAATLRKGVGWLKNPERPNR